MYIVYEPCGVGSPAVAAAAASPYARLGDRPQSRRPVPRILTHIYHEYMHHAPCSPLL